MLCLWEQGTSKAGLQTSLKPGEQLGSGGGTGQGRGGSEISSSSPSTTTTMGGKAGAAAKVLKNDPAPQMATSSTATTGNAKNDQAVDEAGKGSGDGGTGGDQPSKSGAEELLQEATQLLKSLRVKPKINVMRIGELERSRPDTVLVDSGATHALRPARDLDEWLKSEPTIVTLAEGTTSRFRLKPNTKILLSEPGQPEAWIVPMGGLTELDFIMQWTGNQCTVRDDVGREIAVHIQNGCPMISLQDGQHR